MYMFSTASLFFGIIYLVTQSLKLMEGHMLPESFFFHLYKRYTLCNIDVMLTYDLLFR